MSVTWTDGPFKKEVIKRGMDGLEEFALTVWLPQAKINCPVAPENGGTMRNSLGYERDDNQKVIFAGGGGAAKDYIFKQEMDRSLHHTTGKPGFINDSLQQNISKLPEYVKKHVG
jgi:hypothetical protein